jgi:hypothetical protein
MACDAEALMLGVLLGPAGPARLLAATLFDHEAAALGGHVPAA